MTEIQGNPIAVTGETRSALPRWRPERVAASLERTSAPHRRRPLQHALVDAAAKTVLTCAVLHLLLLAVRTVAERDPSRWNLFTLIEADRVWPILAPTPATQALSGVVALLIFIAWWKPRKQRHAAHITVQREPSPHRNGVASAKAAADRLAERRALTLAGSVPDAPAKLRPGLALAFVVAFVGVAIHMGSLALIERFVAAFPSIPDVLQARLPYVDFGVPGEMVFVAFVVTILWVYIRRQAQSVPSVIFLLGVFYAIRGVFLFLLPIGSPPTAPAIAERFTFYPYAEHAFFPGGHAGLMTIVSLAIRDRRWRRAMLGAAAVFALGTVVARTHYTADAIGGAVLGYALVSWGRTHLALLAPGDSLWWGGRIATERAARTRPVVAESSHSSSRNGGGR